MKNKKKKKWIIISSIIAIVFIAVIGRIVYMHNKFNNDMIRIANSEKAHKVYKQGIINLDKHAFSKGSKIQSYKVDQNSISHNPMGGIDVTLIINNDKELTQDTNIDSQDNGKTINDDDGSAISPKLSDMTEKENRK